MKFKPVEQIAVGLDFGLGSGEKTISVGRLAMRDGVIYFEYDDGFLKQGLDLSPRILPLEPGVKSFDRHLFNGLPGAFNDSLPDGWGRLLFDRMLKSNELLPNDASPLDRLAYVGHTGIGALVYDPDHGDSQPDTEVSLDTLAEQAADVLEGDAGEVITELLTLNGSSSGARPKAMIAVDANHKNIIHGVSDVPSTHQHWLVKFPKTEDGIDAGAVEYVYSIMAKEAGIEMMDTHLFEAEKGAGYFASKRFDRNTAEGEGRAHAHTACGILHSDFRTPTLDYKDLISLTQGLTKDIREAEKMYRLAVFNVLAHNQDDHSKNFSYLMNSLGEWKLSPAYDLTFSSGPGGEQSATVGGRGKNIDITDLQRLAQKAGLDKEFATQVIERAQDALSNWPTLAKEYSVHNDTAAIIQKRLSVRLGLSGYDG
jgi:serine/threonine-protein kinase HipA